MKIGFLITARLKSKRLPLKIIKDLNGKTIIERIIDRTKAVNGISEIVLCTSPNPQDKPLIEIAESNEIPYFLGDEVDVLKRLRDASKLFDLDYILNITADNPLVDINYSNQIVNEIKHDKYDFININGLPLGSAPSGLKVKALETLCEIKKIKDTEIWGYLIQPEIFEIKTIKATGNLKRPELRLTVDYEEDYELMSNIYKNITFEDVLDLNDVIKYLDDNPALININKYCVQMDLDEKTKNEIKNDYKENIDEVLAIKDFIYGKKYL